MVREQLAVLQSVFKFMQLQRSAIAYPRKANKSKPYFQTGIINNLVIAGQLSLANLKQINESIHRQPLTSPSVVNSTVNQSLLIDSDLSQRAADDLHIHFSARTTLRTANGDALFAARRRPLSAIDR